MSPAILLGYDAVVLARLSRPHQQTIQWLATVWGLCIGLIAALVGYSGYLAERSWFLSVATTVVLSLFLLNLLRLATAGRAGDPRQSLSQEPSFLQGSSWVMPGMFVFLTAIFAQPVHLALVWDEHSALVDAHRRALSSSQTQAAEIAQLSMNGLPNSEIVQQVASYQTRLAECPFLLIRLQALMQRPHEVVRFTLAFVMLILLPALLSHTWARFALRAYDDERLVLHAGLIDRDNARTDYHTGILLSRYVNRPTVS